ncbi:MAG: phosphatidylglycerophosphatase A [Deltaproteobacteria bacterium]|nr:phosphatidylglycerophosphatase A [Deltaproteobacteria bacterium]
MKKTTRDDWIIFLAGGCGLGGLPRAPGTWGSLGALPLWLIFSAFGVGGYLLILMVLTIIAVRLADAAGKLLGVEDSPVIVIDEIVGLLLALTGVPLGLGNAVAAFLIFRFFDICKPFPANWCDANLDGGVGVVADDLVAGAMTWVVMRILFV